MGRAKEPGLIESADVAAVFASYPEDLRQELLELRELILDTAYSTAGVGAIEETLRWGQPAYLTSETGSGSTIRIAPTRPDSTHDYAMYFICHTNLVETFQALFGESLFYEGERALLFTVGVDPPKDELRECISLALTYHQSKI